jgi:hypothetical protein
LLWLWCNYGERLALAKGHDYSVQIKQKNLEPALDFSPSWAGQVHAAVGPGDYPRSRAGARELVRGKKSVLDGQLILAPVIVVSQVAPIAG